MFIKSIKSYIPGHTDNKYGALVPTSYILDQIKSDETVESTFLQRVLGVESVAATFDTIEASNSKNPHSRNEMLYKSLEEICRTAIGEVADQFSYVAHIHIAGYVEPCIEHALGDIREKLGIPGLNTILLIQGCAGILTALDLAKRLCGEDQNVLITAENNTMVHVHNRYRRYAERSNLDDWLFSSIIGDAVGAMVVSPTPSGKCLEVDTLESKYATKEWRVKEHIVNDVSLMKMKAKDVRKTYTENVSYLAANAITAAGGIENLEYVLLHESNPKMLQEVADQLEIPEEKRIILSNKIGTTAAVSSFSLLSQAVDKIRENDDNISRNIALVVLGESGIGINTGSMILKWNIQESQNLANMSVLSPQQSMRSLDQPTS